jgi:hypothetical protein
MILAALTGCAYTQPRPAGQNRLSWQLRTPRDLPAPVQQAAIEPGLRTVHLATLGNLYEVRDAKAVALTKSPVPEARIMLAPGGGVYAWLIPNGKPEALYGAQLKNMEGKVLANLTIDEPPHGFGILYLGFRGGLIVTAAALDDWRGIRGRYLYTFWSLEGKVLRKLIRPSRGIGILAEDGTALLLLGEKEATAYSPDGTQLWQLDGRYRKGAIAGHGKLALLNPAQREGIDQVHLFTGSAQPIVLKVPTPVHHLRIAPDGSVGMVGGDRGRYFFLDPAAGKLGEGKRLPFDGELFLTDLELVDSDTLALGVLLRQDDPPRHTWPRGGIAVVSRRGEVLFRREYPIREPLSSRPAVDVTFGVPAAVGFTLDTTVLINLGQ